ncbi:MAG: MFS transporter [Nitrososphaerota archaeon]|nr:MFS transporter [Nitrososphaerota archaeon]MDG6955913.1 MFS transporter [Nitrososphaerota archaeon]MDG6959281.1 MFS transporter [Nitrososphaerota archaeon]MDG6969130.1 MFS transporter [Nitrososphaerota archaeon]MDG6971990.1 MFS transporter [Nitrososphaerota archaeon]
MSNLPPPSAPGGRAASGSRSLLILSLYQMLSNNRSSLFTVYFVLYVVQKDGVSVAAGLAAFSAAYVASSLVGPFAGRLSDRLGRRRLLLIAAEALSLPFFVAIPFMGGFIAISVFFLLAETILSFGSTALQAYVADVTSSKERGRGYGFISQVGAVGSIIGVVAAGVVSEAFSIDAIFYLVGIFMAADLLLLVFALPESRITPSRTRRPLREMKGVLVFSFATSIRTLGTGAVTAFIGTYAYFLGANDFEVSLVAVAGLATTALLATRLGSKVDALGEIRGYLYGTMTVGGSLLIFVLAGAWPELIPARIIYAAGFGLLSPAMLSWVSKIAPEGRTAEYLGVFSLVNSTLWSFGPLPGGLIQGLLGNVGLFAFAIVATAGSVVAVYALYWKPTTAAGAASGPVSPGDGVVEGA